MIWVAIVWHFAVWSSIVYLLVEVYRLNRGRFSILSLQIHVVVCTLFEAINIAALVVCYAYMVTNLHDPLADLAMAFAVGIVLGQGGGYVTWVSLVRTDRHFRESLLPFIARLREERRLRGG